MTGTYPRQPRSGCPPNLASAVKAGSAHPHLNVQLQLCGGGTFPTIQMVSGQRARAVAANLNTLFGKDGADLDFIHMTRYHDGTYAVVWAPVSWSQSGSTTTDIGHCPAGDPYTTNENLYRPSPLFEIATVSAEDVHWYGKPAWKIAFLWTNNIRYAVNGWNSTQDVMNPPLFSGVIRVLAEPTMWQHSSVTLQATRYGYGECQPNFTTANNDIFHTMDLVVAVPGNAAGQARWKRNQWVQVAFQGRSAHARLTDVCGCNNVDLSRGLATYLGFPGSGKVTVSNP
ncbi:MAG: rare lipoprotein [Actinomycetota bacterium]|nr:rare lipoprotein [Actinomycetota bacterium]